MLNKQNVAVYLAAAFFFAFLGLLEAFLALGFLGLAALSFLAFLAAGFLAFLRSFWQQTSWRPY